MRLNDWVGWCRGLIYRLSEFFSHDRVRNQMATNNTTIPVADTNPVVGNSDASHVPIVVNLRAAISASANVAVFGPSEEQVGNVVWCTATLPVAALYTSAEQAMFQIWEPASARGEIRAQVHPDASESRANAFRDGLHAVLQAKLDASAANPFQGYKADSKYYEYMSFGELALSYAAEGMFGHPSATVAITNDGTIVAGFNLENTTSAKTPVTANMNGQALAQRLAHELFKSSPEVARAIAEVVLGQDARRATNEDNSELQVDAKVPLRFYAGDVIYVQITLSGWTSSNGNSAPGFLNQAFTPAELGAQSYYLRIELS